MKLNWTKSILVDVIQVVLTTTAGMVTTAVVGDELRKWHKSKDAKKKHWSPDIFVQKEN